MVINLYYWPRVKNEIVEYIFEFLGCYQVKVEYRHPLGLLKPLQIAEWRWEVISMDFLIRLEWIAKQHDEIMVVLDHLSKASHFIPIKST